MKEYLAPKLEIVIFDNQDVITWSTEITVYDNGFDEDMEVYWE